MDPSQEKLGFKFAHTFYFMLEVSGDTPAMVAAEERKEFQALQGLAEFVEHWGHIILLIFSAEYFPPQTQLVGHFEEGQ